MAYNVGQVEVTVLPNAQRFNAEFAAEVLPQMDVLGREIGDRIAEQIKTRLAAVGDVNIGVDTGKASADVDRFLVDTKAKTAAASKDMGEKNGSLLSQGMHNSLMRNSPLLVAGAVAGLTLGAPAMIGAAGLLFGGIAAAAVHSNEQLKQEFNLVGDDIQHVFTQAAQVTVPFFIASMSRLGAAVRGLQPQFAAAFSALQVPLDSLTTGVINLVSNAMPGLVAAVRSANPVFQGLSSLMGSIGTGLGQFFQIIAQHGNAAGTMFSALGDILSALLPALGDLVSAGTELGANVFPPLASALHLVADVLHVIAPILPAVAAGFLAFKGVGLLSGPLSLLSAKMQTVAADASGLGTRLAGGVAGAASKAATALPAVGTAVAVIGGLMQAASQQIQQWGQALLDGGTAAETATAQIQRQSDLLTKGASGWGSQIIGVTGFADALGVGSNAMDSAKQAAADLYKAMSPLQQRQQDVTTATNNLDRAIDKYGKGSPQAAAASDKLGAAQGRLTREQAALKVATESTMTAEQRHSAALKAIGDAASAAAAETNALKTALDSLSGKTVTTTEAQIALQGAIADAATATKGQAGAVKGAHGELNTYTAAGRAAGTALIGIRDKGNQLIATLEQQGATSAQVRKADADLRASFILTARNMGFSADEANNLADQILGIPASRNTRITADTAAANAAIRSVKSALMSIGDRTVYVRTITLGDGSQQIHRGVQATAGAIGGVVHAYANGGIEPMSGGIAQIVPPNRLRVIGDRITNDEAFIPINRDLRSQQIWMEAGQRMGMLGTVSPGGRSSTATASQQPLVSVGTMIVPDKQHPQETAEALAFLARTRG